MTLRRWWMGAAAGLCLLSSSPARAQAIETSASAKDRPDPGFGSSALRIAGFGNLDFTARSPAGERRQFQLGPVDLYMTSRMSDHWSGLVELVFESSGNELGTDLERFVVTYDRSDRLRIRAGREHNPLVRWNAALHHGLFMQLPIERPAMARFEDEPGAWPVHFVGLMASGHLSGSLGLHYGVGVGNGRGHIADEVQVSFDANASKAKLVWLGAAPSFLIGWEVFATAYADTIPAADGPLRERDVTLSTTYVGRGLEVRAEWGRMSHDPVGNAGAHRTTGWYALASRRLPGRAEVVRPYVLLDHLRIAEGEKYLEGIPDRSDWLLGARWDMSGGSALKAEYQSQKAGAGERESVVRFQLAVSF